MPIPLLWVLGSAGVGFVGGWFSSSRGTLLLIGGAALAVYLYKNK